MPLPGDDPSQIKVIACTHPAVLKHLHMPLSLMLFTCSVLLACLPALYGWRAHLLCVAGVLRLLGRALAGAWGQQQQLATTCHDECPAFVAVAPLQQGVHSMRVYTACACARHARVAPLQQGVHSMRVYTCAPPGMQPSAVRKARSKDGCTRACGGQVVITFDPRKHPGKAQQGSMPLDKTMERPFFDRW